MAILTYFDVSGDSAHRALAVGGFLARPEQWQEFDVRWRAALAAEGVEELHMRHFAHSVKGFHDWKGDERRRANFLERLTDVINTCTLKSVAVSLDIADYKAFDRVYMLREAWGGPYTMASVFAMGLASRWRDLNQPDEPISFLFESGDNEQRDLPRYLKRWKFDGAFNLSFLPKRWVEKGHVQYHYPFQACDFVAYEIGKAARTLFAQDAEAGERVEAVKARKSLMRIAPKERDKTWRFIDEGLLTEFCHKVRRRPRLR